MTLLDRIQQKDAAPPGLVPRQGLPGVPKVRPALESSIIELKNKIHQRLVRELTSNASSTTGLSPKVEDIRGKAEVILDEELAQTELMVTRDAKLKLLDTLVNDMVGLGPLQELVNDEEITEIMVNGPNQIYIEKAGKLYESSVTFDTQEQLQMVIDRIVTPIGRRIDESQPMVDARLADGSRVNIIIPPLSLGGSTITIRKFPKNPLTIQDLVELDSITQQMVDYLMACVEARLNIVVSGGTGSGKTTFLNILSSFVPGHERIVTIEDAAELQLNQEHVLSLETRPPNVEGKGQVTIRDLVTNALRMRPDRIIVGECRSGEALDMLQAMNTGHDGSLTTIHANSPIDMLSRLETLVLMAGTELPSRAIREQIASAIQIIVQQAKVRGGKRKIVSIAEVVGYNAAVSEGEFVLNELFKYHQRGVDDDGNAFGVMAPTGNLPFFMERMQGEGVTFPEGFFQAPPA